MSCWHAPVGDQPALAGAISGGHPHSRTLRTTHWWYSVALCSAGRRDTSYPPQSCGPATCQGAGGRGLARSTGPPTSPPLTPPPHRHLHRGSPLALALEARGETRCCPRCDHVLAGLRAQTEFASLL